MAAAPRPQPLDAERLRSELTEYRPEMGIANRDLVVGMHSAHTHVNDVVAVLLDCPGAPGPLANHFANLPASTGGSGTPSLGWRRS